jgi:putative transposase
MARKLRIRFPGAIYHVAARGNARQDIFCDDRDREHFLDRLAEAVERYAVRLYLYCLMTNHLHLLVETPAGNLDRFMGSLLTSLAVYFNKKYDRVGHVTQGRYAAPLVSGDEYLLRLSRYIHRNPVWTKAWRTRPLAARLAGLRAYPWSSYRGYAGYAQIPKFIEAGPLLDLVAMGRRPRLLAYRRFVETGLGTTDEEIQTLLQKSPHAMGPPAFVERVGRAYSAATGKRRRPEDVALRKTARRVPAEEIVRAVCRAARCEEGELTKIRMNDHLRPLAVEALVTLGGLTQREAAPWVGLRTGAGVCAQLRRGRALRADAWFRDTRKRVREDLGFEG